MRPFWFASAVLMLTTVSAPAAVKTEVVEYTYNGTKLKGFLAYDDAATGKRPGVMVVHEWWGLDDYARKRATMLAELGYVAFAADMYGEGKVAKHPMEASEMAGTVRKNLDNWLGRAKAGLEILSKHEKVDSSKLAAIGYCFGGSTALQLAHAGTDLKAVVSFHGALPVPSDSQAKAVKAEVLICHGADDSFIPEKAITGLRKAYDSNKVKYTFESYPGAVHSFTVPSADSHGIKGMGYNAAADQKSWQSMQTLLKSVFADK
ncbi:dienelactone hydrolase family protein [Tuwongella immobilis]|uniref:Dienelactone hydrolase domain-containing protein n=1 Tax=Tuwongella immobilis TaxID=692036 RepID=A0A6C2YKS8_9BACT|nr:dienelactone hydrolase family protein [Tuwongella immobilis]VIP01839.1 dienelactone hydrolase : Dienelactone hydrolase OS=Planctomyces limnophilus (strain ATCC 43296 / DSM 3776 / IFAM 1008 / 290) GN=Plim_2218 PE=4 SV=1: DLH [Tuwongella immobilis]VTR99605.1 dienelactone hydrolase : Dienelactone hydrolase OS=Planctomyces limnophilus (strain ATCC 43296 / DSM 3776 / IFAM 1008 / 290) GN=Plim_2218 PE=4 SV=1: DLH [Tuwongella immobilis]